MKMPMPTDVEFEGIECIAKTDAAILCRGGDLDKKTWFPESQLVNTSEVIEEGDSGTLIITEWIAMQKGLV